MRHRRRLLRLRLVGDLVILCAVLWVVLGPTGPLGAPLRGWWEARWIAGAAEASWEAVTSEGGALGGPTRDGPVLVVFSDYRCPFCRRGQGELDALLRRRPGTRVLLRHLPVERLHPDAPRLARVAVCAEDDPDFPTLHRALFAAPEAADDGVLEGVLRNAGIDDPAAVLACAEGAPARERVRRDVELAVRLGIRGTPTWVGPGGARIGAASAAALEELLPRVP